MGVSPTLFLILFPLPLPNISTERVLQPSTYCRSISLMYSMRAIVFGTEKQRKVSECARGDYLTVASAGGEGSQTAEEGWLGGEGSVRLHGWW